MKYLSTLLALLTSTPLVSAQIPTSLDETLALGLPVLSITTEDAKEPSCSFVACPPGCMGTGIKAEKIPGSVTRYSPDGTIEYSSGEYVKNTGGMKIKVRGNTSAQDVKKPYKIKLEKKADLLNRDKSFKDKNWILINDMRLYATIGFTISELLGQEWTPAHEFVNVIMNGDFRGTYLLVEAIERNTDCRINVADDGFVVEHDAYWWNENGEYVPSSMTPSFNYTFKYPDFEDMTDRQIDYISQAVLDFEQSVNDATYDRYINVDSFARWYLIHDIMGTGDPGGANFYLTKYDSTADSKFNLTPAWDFDMSLATPGIWARTHTMRFQQLFSSSNPAFLAAYVKLWNEIGWDVYDKMKNILDDMEQNSDAFNKSVQATNARWQHGFQTTTQAVPKFRDWYDERQMWIHQQMEALSNDIPTAVGNVGVENGIFTICGNTVTSTTPVYLGIFTPDGTTVFDGMTSTFTLPAPGLYIIRSGSKTVKVII